MMEHLIILGGEQYLPFARSRIKALRATGLKYATQSFEIDGATVRVRIEGNHDHIYLEGGGNHYQFFTTGAAAEFEARPVALAPYAEARKGYIVRVSEDRKDIDTKVEASATGSSVEVSTTDPKLWEFYSVAELGAKLKTGFQIQAYQQATNYRAVGDKGKQSNKAVISSWGSSTPLHSLTMRGGLGTVYSALSSPTTDLLYDVAPKVGAQAQVPDADWYRQAATHTVTDEKYGTRRFVIMVDVGNTFHAYPVGNTDKDVVPNPDYINQAIKTNVAEKFVQRVRSPLPEWAASADISSRDYFRDGAKTLRHYYAQVPQYKWAFNSTGKKACAVVMERLGGATTEVEGEDVPLTFVMAGTTHRFVLQEALPGLVGLEFTITLTGKNLEDFTFGVAVAKALQPTVDGRYIMGADYAWKIDGKTALDDIILLTGQIYHTSAVRKLAGKVYYPLNHRSTATVFNLTRNTTIRTFLMSNTTALYEADAAPFGVDLPVGAERKTAEATILAMDLRVLAFVVQQKYVEHVATWSGSVLEESAGARQAQRIKVFMRDELIDERIMESPGSPMDAALVATFDNTAAGTALWPITEVGEWSSTIESAYQHMSVLTLFSNFAGTTYNTIRQETVPVIQTFKFDAGAYLYALCLAPLVRYDPINTFVVHPNKSWSLSMRPIFYHAGPAADKDLDGIDLGLFRQTLLDYISFRNTKGTEIKTTHIEQFNSAYDKTVTPADHLYTFSKVQSIDASKKYVRAATPAGGILFFPISNNGDTPPLKLYQFDANYPNFGVITAKAPNEPFRAGMPVVLDTYYSFRAPGDSWAMTGGSALFY